MGRWKKVLIFISVLFFWLLVWQAAAFAVGRELILAGPIAVATVSYTHLDVYKRQSPYWYKFCPIYPLKR